MYHDTVIHKQYKVTSIHMYHDTVIHKLTEGRTITETLLLFNQVTGTLTPHTFTQNKRLDECQRYSLTCHVQTT